jgi:hypothetical protein
MGVGTTKGDLYVVDENLDLERVGVGTDGQILTANAAVAAGVEWQDSSLAARYSAQMDQTDAIFRRIDLGGGLIALPKPTRKGTHAVLAYDDTVIQGVPWQRFAAPLYDDGDLTLTISWVADAAIIGDVIWAAAFERDEAGHNVLTDGFAALQTSAASTAAGTLGDIVTATIAFTNAQADAISSENPFRLFIQRTADDGGDTMIGDAEIIRAVLTED